MSTAAAALPLPRSALAAGSTLTAALPLKFASGHKPIPMNSQHPSPTNAIETITQSGFTFVCDSHARRLYGVSGGYAGIEIDLTNNTVITIPLPTRDSGYRDICSAVIDPASSAAASKPHSFPSFFSVGLHSCGRIPKPTVLEPITELNHKFVLEHHLPAGAGAAAIDQSADAQRERSAVDSTGCIAVGYGAAAFTVSGGDSYLITAVGVHSQAGVKTVHVAKLNASKGVRTKTGDRAKSSLPAAECIVGGRVLAPCTPVRVAGFASHLGAVPALSVQYRDVSIHSIVSDAYYIASTGDASRVLWLVGHRQDEWIDNFTANTQPPFIDRYQRPFTAHEITTELALARTLPAAALHELIASYACGGGSGDGLIIRYRLPFDACKPQKAVSTPSGLLIFSCQATNSLYTLNPVTGAVELLFGTGVISGALSSEGTVTSAVFATQQMVIDLNEHALYLCDTFLGIRKIKLSDKFFRPNSL